MLAISSERVQYCGRYLPESDIVRSMLDLVIFSENLHAMIKNIVYSEGRHVAAVDA